MPNPLDQSSMSLCVEQVLRDVYEACEFGGDEGRLVFRLIYFQA
jgi:hypothetical protein